MSQAIDDHLAIGNQWFFSSLLLQLRQRWLVACERRFLQNAMAIPKTLTSIQDVDQLNEPFRSLYYLGADNLRRSLSHLALEVTQDFDQSNKHGKSVKRHFLLYLCGFYATDKDSAIAILANALHPRALALFYRRMNFDCLFHFDDRYGLTHVLPREDRRPQMRAFRQAQERPSNYESNAIVTTAMIGELCDILDAIHATLKETRESHDLKKLDRTILKSTAFFISEILADSLELIIDCSKETCLYPTLPRRSSVHLARCLYAGTLNLESRLVSLLREGKYDVIREAVQMLVTHAGNYSPQEKERLRSLLDSLADPQFFFCDRQVCPLSKAHQALEVETECKFRLKQILQPLSEHLDKQIFLDQDYAMEASYADDSSWASFMRRLNKLTRITEERRGSIGDEYWPLNNFNHGTCQVLDTVAVIRQYDKDTAEAEKPKSLGDDVDRMQSAWNIALQNIKKGRRF